MADFTFQAVDELYFVVSDEDDEDSHALLYLPISPEIEDAEDSYNGEQQVLTVIYCDINSSL